MHKRQLRQKEYFSVCNLINQKMINHNVRKRHAAATVSAMAFPVDHDSYALDVDGK